MNLFRILGDLSHLVSVLILLNAIIKARSISGISFKTQLLYSIVFMTRYIDLFFRYVSLYNTLMKVFFIGSSNYILYLMIFKHNYLKSQQPTFDEFKIEYLLIGSAITSLIFNYGYNFTEILWSFSIWLESVAIFPQLFMLQRTGEAELLTTHYIFALGIYRALYIPNWLWRYYMENHFDSIAVIAGIIQTLIYSDFFYIYYKKVIKGMNFKIPV
ncbi:Erd2p [Ascoidea rubescens DSM 1968]|uniref:HDEL receptor, an integral membrane protein that binds to the HDEL motif in protein n=1 Tax=Ascoidea rubescens DSM 1968 TaxID=1344418 RepID=A0A1D2VMA4_9ASCO|nr:HDEL receptor, an integral membrane protein that binds to the HDEL motif in protein [Ascoidea rubescens DSM 1968]ODV62746.1 HDEL receptor, an integral membrane protein that binds to the HDEL motif in protein [Ascoidea rubescens DSM 1968]